MASIVGSVYLSVAFGYQACAALEKAKHRYDYQFEQFSFSPLMMTRRGILRRFDRKTFAQSELGFIIVEIDRFCYR